jgi:hypothetical protein
MAWALDKVANSLPSDEGLLTAMRVSRKKSPLRNHAVRVNELIIHNNRTGFGEGDIRLDSLADNFGASKHPKVG